MSSPNESGHQGLIYKVAVPSPLRRLFDYLPPAADIPIKPGTRVQIQFGRRKIVGYVVEQTNQSELNTKRLKPIHAVLDSEPLYSPKFFNLLQWCAQYYHHPLGEVLSTASPGKLRTARSVYQQETYFHLKADTQLSDSEQLSRAPKQKELFTYLCNNGAVNRTEILDKGFTSALLKSLVDKQLIESEEREAARAEQFTPLEKTNSKSLDLNPEQQIALNTIKESGNDYNCFLIDGVTGSGKTEVYMQAMQDHLSAGRQCLVLVPEIGLTPQTVSRFRSRFSCPIASMHSGMSDNERLDAWIQARDGAAGIVIGTRSAIFTPLPNLGIIIIDEEHDGSFKQQDGFRYSARDVAVKRGREENVPVILGSATPSLESLQNANLKKFQYLSLSKRAGDASESAMTVIDTSQEILDTGFSEQLLFKIEQHLNARNQVLVFINRRGFAPILNCAQCGWLAECENCVAQMTVHARPPSMRCHHCGTSQHLPSVCPDCNGDALSTVGVGTQKLEKFLNRRFASIPVIRIDRDSTRNKHNLAAMLDQIHTGEPCILLGTQMLAKGHHFPFITLVAIVDADSGLFSPDFRGQEFMAQTVVQVSGRAGRAERSGEVVIQSRHSTHKTLTQLGQESYSVLAKILMEERKIAAMPPFYQLALIKAEGPQLKTTLEFLKRINTFSNDLIQHSNSSVLAIGPVPTPMEKKAGRFRSHLLFKAKTKSSMQRFLAQLVYQIDQLKPVKGLRWSLDVDPLDMI
ncbi:MAG: primosomal protein N' [Pseudomonadales bacterium]|nr:primosomal protein N' [Pseudomonadales bacterium]